jgi:glyoxylase-like metal-dependent hydrolase (beta-lactamase superfamily II)
LAYAPLIGDSEELRRSVRDTMGPGVPLELGVVQGTFLDLGEVTVEFLDVAGHVPGELGLLVPQTRTLILGDAMTGLHLPFFHGHTSPRRYRQTLQRIRELVASGQVQTVWPNHLPAWQTPSAIEAAIREREEHLNQLDAAIYDTVRERTQTLEEVWRDISRKWHKVPEFRGLAMVHAHLQELVASGQIVFDGEYYAAR